MANEIIQEYCDNSCEEAKKYIYDFSDFMKLNFPQMKPELDSSILLWLVGANLDEGYVGISATQSYFSIYISDADFIMELKRKNLSFKGERTSVNIFYGDDEIYNYIKQAITGFLNSIIDGK